MNKNKSGENIFLFLSTNHLLSSWVYLKNKYLKWVIYS